jgi:hypothetical protein
VTPDPDVEHAVKRGSCEGMTPMTYPAVRCGAESGPLLKVLRTR